MLSPQDETPSTAMDVQPEEIDLAIAMDRFHKLCDFKVARIYRSWAGLRTLTPDRCPAVGFSNPDENFFGWPGKAALAYKRLQRLGA